MSSVTDVVELWSAARHAIATVERRLDTVLTERLGLSFTTYAVLCTIAELGSKREVSQQHIADALGIDKSNASRHIEAAVQAGLVSSAPSLQSRRSKSVGITPAGRTALAAAEELVADFASTLEPAAVRQTTRFLSGIGD